ncbi:MAG: M81 family metallopeptidase [Pirellulaceae bacterium]
MANKPRIGILALLQESNTFISQPTTFEHFASHLLLEGEAIREKLAASHHEIGGFFETLDEADAEVVPIFAARALPFGRVQTEAIEQLLRRMFAALEKAGPLDGLLLAPHGATVSVPYPDADGHWLSEVRRRVGGDTPLIGTLDPHANLSAKMVEACDALISYRTNPHIDQRARGREAAALLLRTLAGEARPTMAASFPPMAIDIEQQCTNEEPCLSYYRLVDEVRRRPGVLSCSVMLGFPYADVAEMGSAVVVVADGDADLARQEADRLGAAMWQRRGEFIGKHIHIDEALDQAAALGGPICLLDMGDNVGGGSPGDGTLLAHAIAERKMPRALVCLYDPESVAAAETAGVGASLELSVGGKSDQLHGPPLFARFEVLGLYEGKFQESEARHGGMTHFDQGRTAVVRTEHGLTVMLTSRRMTPFSLQQLISCELDPGAFHLLVAKGVNAPLAAYAPVCKHILRVDTPGVTTADMTRLEYAHRREPMFPFEIRATW